MAIEIKVARLGVVLRRRTARKAKHLWLPYHARGKLLGKKG